MTRKDSNLQQALRLMEAALELMDDETAALAAAGHLDLAIHRLRDALDPTKSP